MTPRELEDHRFWAFISYSHHDEKFVKRLHRALETYCVPRPLVGTRCAGIIVPRRLTPIFRDRDELASAPDLSHQIRTALQHSHTLLVVCSPESARSPHVNEEIAWFKSMGRARRVISVIVSGEPNTGQADECFPKALLAGEDGTREVTPIAADARPGKDGNRGSLQKVVAGILDVPLDELRHRERQRQRQNAVHAALSSLAVLVFLAVAYAGLSDAKVPLPGAATVRSWLDARDLTLFRPVAPADVIRQTAAAQRREVAARLLALQMPDGTFSYRMSDVREGDSWTAAQLLAALATTPEVDRQMARKMNEAFDGLFRAYVVRDAGGVAGFLFERGRPPNGVISLWMVSALARALARHDLFEAGQYGRLLGFYRVAIAAADRLAPLQDGGWNMYAEQDAPAAHNTYTTVLALQALLDVRAARLPWGERATVDPMIRKAAAWLIANFRQNDVDTGWSAAPSTVVEVETNILDGLSLQVFATLLRAEHEAGVALPVALVDAMSGRLLGAGERAPEFPKDESDFPTQVAGRYEKEGIGFTWAPWTLEASVRWLQRTDGIRPPPAQIRAVRRIVSRIVTGHDHDFFRYAVGKERKTYEASEYLLGLSQLR